MLDKTSVGASFAGAVESLAGRRHIWLCADDYGISAAVNVAIRDLVVRRRLNATSVMVVAPSFHRSEALALDVLNSGMPRVAIGLHLTLTAPFRPLSGAYRPARDGSFLSLGTTMMRAFLQRLNPDALASEIAAQLRMFVHTFGRPPDFIDGHQHVHLFPQIREAMLEVAKASAPDAWLRQCGRAVPPRFRFGDRKAWLLDRLSHDFRERANALGRRTNPAFAGAYDFRADADFAALFAGFLEQVPDGGLIMCHPGFVDADLQRLDPLTTLREREYAFLAGTAFPELLASHGLTLA
ncbi:MAG TPA: ChbG/HpnK family deacetylase [Xanthobacteraceae bacterium]